MPNYDHLVGLPPIDWQVLEKEKYSVVNAVAQQLYDTTLTQFIKEGAPIWMPFVELFEPQLNIDRSNKRSMDAVFFERAGEIRDHLPTKYQVNYDQFNEALQFIINTSPLGLDVYNYHNTLEGRMTQLQPPPGFTQP